MSGAESQKPISSHPAFRWAVALWFAALLAGGLFVMPEPVVANLRGMLGVDRFVGNALMARLVLSALAGLFGFLLGLVIALRIAAFNEVDEDDDPDDVIAEESGDDTDVWFEDHDEPTEGAVEDEAPRRPFNPREYLTDDGFEAPTAETAEASEPIDADYEELVEEAVAEKPRDEVAEDVILLGPPAEAESEAELAESDAEPDWPDVGAAPVAAQTTTPADVPPVQAPPTGATGDLSLSELTARLAQAIAAQRAAEEKGAFVEETDVDPVIAFLRREADRSAPLTERESGRDDPQAELRSALDRLSQVGKRP